MDMLLISAVSGFGVAAILNIVAYAFWAGKVSSKLEGILHRLDRQNGRLDSHSERLDDQGERVASLEGRRGLDA